MNQQDQNKSLDVDCGSDSSINIDQTQVRNSLPSIPSPENRATHDHPNSIYLDVVKHYYQTVLKYPHVYSGLQFGCHYVLYRDHPQVVHSTYAIYVIHPTTTTTGHTNVHTNIPWYTIQTLVRMMADLHKILILLHIEELPTNDTGHDKQIESEEAMRSRREGENCRNTSIYTSAGSTTHETQHQKSNSKIVYYPSNGKTYSISELTVTTEHAPFRQQQLHNNTSKVM